MSETETHRTGSSFTFFPACGERIDLMTNDSIVFEMRFTRGGKRVLIFPPPYCGIEIFEGERVGNEKWMRVKAAIAALNKGQEK